MNTKLDLTAVYAYLTDFAELEKFWESVEMVFGASYDRALIQDLRSHWQSGDFSELPPIQVLSSGMDGIAGAYARSTNTIYLSQIFLDTASSSQIIAVILEEIGHGIDAKINTEDSHGDEGELFSNLVRGISITSEQIQAIQSQNDFATILLNTQPLSVETAAIPPIISVRVSSDILEDGSNKLVFTFTRPSDFFLGYTETFNVGYVLSGSAVFGVDYTTSGVVTFTSGSPTATLTVTPIADHVFESDETVQLVVSPGANYYIPPLGSLGSSTNPATGKILNDDSSISLSVSLSAVNEDGLNNLVYTFTRTGYLNRAITVSFNVSGTASFNTDYTLTGAATFSGTSGTVNFAAGASTATLTIDSKGDLVIEGNETVVLTLTNGIGYRFVTPSAVTGIINNDDYAGFTVSQIPSNSTTASLLLSDDFTATGTTNVLDPNFNIPARQTGYLRTAANWVKSGNIQLGNGGISIDSGNYLLLADLGTAAIDQNFNGIYAEGGLKISFRMAPNATGSTNTGVWGGLSLGLSATNKNVYIANNAPHFGILFRGNGDIRAFDGSKDITGSYSSWGGTGNDNTLYPFTVVLTDPTDNNPFDGKGQTNVAVYANTTLIYSYIKGNGGYSDNYINFSGFERSGLDDLKIERLNVPLSANLLLADTFTATGTTSTSLLNYNASARQSGSLGVTNWVGTGNVQVGNSTPGIDSGNYLLLSSGGRAALDRNFNGTVSQGGLKVSFDLASNATGNTDQNVWGSFNLGLSSLNKLASVNSSVAHFGILFRGSGGIQAFDGNVDITGGYSSWGGTSNNSTLKPFTVLLTDPTDNNPFDGVGQTNIDVYANNTLIYSYIKGNGGYSDNYINFGGLSVAGVDNLKIERLGETLKVTEGGATDTFTVVLNRAPTANVTVTLNGGTQLTTSRSTLTFTPTNWNIAQTVLVSAVEDSVGEGTHQSGLTAIASSTDPNYNGLIVQSVAATIIDNDLITTGIRSYVEQTGTANPFKDIDVDYFSNPVLVDVDRDRDLDLIVGARDGTLRYYANIGTTTDPVFSLRTATNSPFSSIDVGTVARPTFADITGDGYVDLVVGTAEGTLSYFRNNTAVGGAPSFIAQQGSTLNPFDGIDVGSLSSPVLADIDGDGDADLVVGGWDGTLKYYRNTGSFTNPRYIAQTSAANNPFNGIAVGANSSPIFIEADNDGDFDLLIGENNGNFTYYRNTGTAMAPVFTLQAGSLFYDIKAGTYVSPALGDLNGDGALDVVAGNSDGNLKYFLNQAVATPVGPTVAFNGTNLTINLEQPTTPEPPSDFSFLSLNSTINIVNTSNNANQDLTVVVSDSLFATGTTLIVGNLNLNLNLNTQTEPSFIFASSFRIIDPSSTFDLSFTDLLSLLELENQAIADASSNDPGTLQAALLNIIVQAANKTELERTQAEKAGVDWLAGQVKQNRIAERQKALDLYNYWRVHPYTRDQKGNLLPDRYQTPQGFGFTNYDVVAGTGLASVTGLPYPPDFRQHAKAIIHNNLSLTLDGQVKTESLIKGLGRNQQSLTDANTLFQSMRASGAGYTQIGAAIYGIGLATGVVVVGAYTAALTAAVSTATVATVSAAGLVGTLSIGFAASLPGISSVVSLAALQTASVTVGSSFLSAAGTSAFGVAGAIIGTVAIPTITVAGGIAAAAGYGVQLFGGTFAGYTYEGSVNIPSNLQSELAAAQNENIDLKAFLADQTKASEVFTAFIEATLGEASGTYLDNNKLFVI